MAEQPCHTWKEVLLLMADVNTVGPALAPAMQGKSLLSMLLQVTMAEQIG